MIFLYYLWNGLSFQIRLFIISVFFAQIFSLTFTAFSNPGIITGDEEYSTHDIKMCPICKFPSLKSDKVIHCKTCDACIISWDHHCLWTSKCIGKNNLYSFYSFVVISLVYLISLYIGFFLFIFNN